MIGDREEYDDLEYDDDFVTDSVDPLDLLEDEDEGEEGGVEELCVFAVIALASCRTDRRHLEFATNWIAAPENNTSAVVEVEEYLRVNEYGSDFVLSSDQDSQALVVKASFLPLPRARDSPEDVRVVLIEAIRSLCFSLQAHFERMEEGSPKQGGSAGYRGLADCFIYSPLSLLPRSTAAPEAESSDSQKSECRSVLVYNSFVIREELSEFLMSDVIGHASAPLSPFPGAFLSPPLLDLCLQPCSHVRHSYTRSRAKRWLKNQGIKNVLEFNKRKRKLPTILIRKDLLAINGRTYDASVRNGDPFYQISLIGRGTGLVYLAGSISPGEVSKITVSIGLGVLSGSPLLYARAMIYVNLHMLLFRAKYLRPPAASESSLPRVEKSLRGATIVFTFTGPSHVLSPLVNVFFLEYSGGESYSKREGASPEKLAVAKSLFLQQFFSQYFGEKNTILGHSEHLFPFSHFNLPYIVNNITLDSLFAVRTNEVKMVSSQVGHASEIVGLFYRVKVYLTSPKNAVNIANIAERSPKLPSRREVTRKTTHITTKVSFSYVVAKYSLDREGQKLYAYVLIYKNILSHLFEQAPTHSSLLSAGMQIEKGHLVLTISMTALGPELCLDLLEKSLSYSIERVNVDVLSIVWDEVRFKEIRHTISNSFDCREPPSDPKTLADIYFNVWTYRDTLDILGANDQLRRVVKTTTAQSLTDFINKIMEKKKGVSSR